MINVLYTDTDTIPSNDRSNSMARAIPFHVQMFIFNLMIKKNKFNSIIMFRTLNLIYHILFAPNYLICVCGAFFVCLHLGDLGALRPNQMNFVHMNAMRIELMKNIE